VELRTRLWILTVSSLILVLAFALWYELTHYQKAYEQLTRGSTKVDAVRRFGKPGRVSDCRLSHLSWDDQPEDAISKRCVEIFEYPSCHSIGRWEVGFDQDGRVVSKGYLQSP
jgi:hypothetical protein